MVQKGLPSQAPAEFDKAAALGAHAFWAASLAGPNIRSGHRGEVERLLGRGYAEPLAMIYAGFGNRDEAFRWLDEAFREDWRNLPTIKISPEFDSLRSDPRLTALLNRMGLK